MTSISEIGGKWDKLLFFIAAGAAIKILEAMYLI